MNSCATPAMRHRRSTLLVVLTVLMPWCLVLVTERSPLSAQQDSTVRPVREPSPPYGSPVLPFGPKGMDVGAIGLQPFTGAHVRASHSVEKLRQATAVARQRGVKLFIRLTGSSSRFQNPDGSFSLELWKRDHDLLRGFDFAPSVADGTVVGAELINEPHVRSKWGGRIISKGDAL